MVIKYEQTTNKYYIKDLGDGTGTFLKITKPLLLKAGYIISYGDTHMVVQVNEDQSLFIKLLEGSKSN